MILPNAIINKKHGSLPKHQSRVLASWYQLGVLPALLSLRELSEGSCQRGLPNPNRGLTQHALGSAGFLGVPPGALRGPYGVS